MVISRGSVKEKKEEAKIENLVNNLAPRIIDWDEGTALLYIIGKDRETGKETDKGMWREKSTIWFEEKDKDNKDMCPQFRKLRDLFRKEGYDAEVAYDKEEEKWAFYIGKDAKELKEKAAPTTSPFTKEHPTGMTPVERAKFKANQDRLEKLRTKQARRKDVAAAKEKEKEKSNERKELAQSLKKAAGQNGKDILDRIPVFERMLEMKETAESKRSRYEVKLKRAKGKKRKKLQSLIKKETVTITDLDKKIKADEKVFRKFIADFKLLEELSIIQSTGIYDHYDPKYSSVLKNQYKIPQVAQQLRNLLTKMPKPAEAKVAAKTKVEVEPAPVVKETSVESDYKDWRSREFEKRFKKTYLELKRDYEKILTRYRTAVEQGVAGEIEKIPEMEARTKGLQDRAKHLHIALDRLSTSAFNASLRKWASKKYGKGTPEYNEVLKLHKDHIKHISTLFKNNTNSLNDENEYLTDLRNEVKDEKKVKAKVSYADFREAEFRKRYEIDWATANKEYLGNDVRITELGHELAIGEVNRVEYLTETSQLTRNKLDHLIKYYKRLSTPGYRKAFIKWARNTYGRGKEYRGAMARYQKTLRIIKKRTLKLRLELRETRKELSNIRAIVAKESLTFDDILKWASMNEVSLAYINRPENQTIIKAMLPFVRGRELARLLEVLDETSLSLMKDEKPPKGPIRIPVKDAKSKEDYEIVRKGISLLYAARALRAPTFTDPIPAARKEWKGLKILRVTNKPDLYIEPNMEAILPSADADGNVFIKHKGRTIWLTEAQRNGIIQSLRTTNIGIQLIKKHDNPKQVDAGGAAMLADYLRNLGFTNVKNVVWSGGKAKANLYIENVPADYWERPTAESMGVLAQKRKEREEDVFLGLGETKLSKDGRIRGYGLVLDDPLDLARFERRYNKLSKEEKEYVDKYYMTSPEKLLSQRSQLEQISNVPFEEGTSTAVFFHNQARARNAAEWLQNVLEARGQKNVVVYVDRNPPFRNLVPEFGGYFLKVRSVSTNAFGERAEVPIRVPKLVGKAGEEILKGPEERSRLESFLNGPTGRKQTYYLDARQAGLLEDYLASINFPVNSIEFTEMKFGSLSKKEQEAWESLQPEASFRSDSIVSAVALTMPESAPPVFLDPKLRRSRHLRLTQQLSRNTFEFKDMSASNRRKILATARAGGSVEGDRVYTFAKSEGGKETAEKVYKALSASQLADVEYDGDKTIIIKKKAPTKPPKEKRMLGERKRVLRERKEQLDSMDSLVAMSQQMSAQQRAIAEQKIRAQDPEITNDMVISMDFGVAPESSTVREAFAEGMGEGKRAYSALVSAALYIHQAYWRGNKLDYLNGPIANDLLEFKNLVAGKGAKFSPDISKRVMQYFALMHSGPGKVSKGVQNVYALQMERMYNALSQFKTYEEFGEKLDFYAYTGILHAANFLTEDMVSRNMEFDDWSPAKQARYRAAVFDTMWRTLVSVMVFESGGPTPNATPPANYAKFQKQYATALTDWLSGRGKYNSFTDSKGNKYRVYDRLIVTQNKERLLTEPIPGDSDNVMAVAKLVRPAELGLPQYDGFTYFAYTELEDYKKQVYPADSTGPVGATPRFRIGTWPTTVTIRRTPGEVEVEKTLSIVPLPEIRQLNVAEWWGRTWKQEDFAMGMIPNPKRLMELFTSGDLKDERVNTLVTVKQVVGTGSNRRQYRLVLPPNTWYDKEGNKIETNYPNGVYASAYADQNGNLYAFRYVDKKKREAYPVNAREHFKKSEAELATLKKKKGIERVRIGAFTAATGKIVPSKGFGGYEQHVQGNWLLNKDNMEEISDKKELDKVAKRLKFTPIPNYHYYSVRAFSAGVDKDVTSKRGERGKIHVSTTIPFKIVKKEKKKYKKKKK